MKVTRKITTEASEQWQWKIGDQITIPLTEIGEFTATVHKVTDEAALFIFDNYVALCPMNGKNTNEGGYDASDLKIFIDTDIYDAFPEWLRNDIYGLTIPSIGEMFGHIHARIENTFESDDDEQLELMKLYTNRIALFNNRCEFGWLRNAVKQEFSVSEFANMNGCGDANYGCAVRGYGVRPEFWLKKREI